MERIQDLEGVWNLSAKLVLVGYCYSGKTALVTHFTRKQFSESYVTTSTFNDTSFNTTLRNQIFDLELCDTAGRLNNKLRRLSYVGANVVLLCFSIDSQRCLNQEIQRFLLEIAKFSPLSQIILVGCKSDLRRKRTGILRNSSTSEEQINYADGLAEARKFGCFAYMECSSKTGEGVQRVFEVAAQSMVEPKPRTPEKTSRKTCAMI